MRCPMCENETLTPVVRHQVELDFCPRCKGVWLDRGELDLLLDVADGIGATYSRTGPAPAASAPPPPRQPPPPKNRRPDRDDRDRDRDDDDDRRERSSRKRKKRKNKFSDLLDDVFDFDFD